MSKYEVNENGGWIIPANTTVTETDIPAYSVIGSNVTFGNFTTFSYYTTFSDNTTFGNFTTFGEHTTYRDLPDCRIAVLSDIDRTGRQLVCVFSGDTCMIEAGGFWGTLKEFTKKARGEGKMLYASVVPAFCEAFLKTLKEKEAEK